MKFLIKLIRPTGGMENKKERKSERTNRREQMKNKAVA